MKMRSVVSNPENEEDSCPKSVFYPNGTALIALHSTQFPQGPIASAPIDLPHVDGYQILGELGRGNMGIVYRARQTSLNRLVALKMVRQEMRPRAEDLSRFVDEARAVARLQHANIVQVYEINLQHQPPYFSMEYVEGGTLSDKLAGRPLVARASAGLIRTLAQAIEVAHLNGIVHRDLKPANILLAKVGSRRTHFLGYGIPELSSFGIPKISDFGLAKHLDDALSQTQTGMILGTPHYMAPEQAEGRSHKVGPAADIYALGAILYEMLTGRPPLLAESANETLRLLFHADPVPPSRLQPNVPRDLETICLKCLEKESRKRYASAEALAEDLRHFLIGEPITARPASAVEQMWKWMRRRPVLAVALASMALLTAVTLGMLSWHYLELESQLVSARLDERQARDAEEAAILQVQLDQRRAKVRELLSMSNTALARQDWRTAKADLFRARDQVADEPELSDLRLHLLELLERTREQEADRSRLEQFFRRRNDTLLHATLFTGDDLPGDLAQTRQAARDALGLVGLDLQAGTGPALGSPSFLAAEKTEVIAGCYELLLALADAIAQPLPSQAEEERQAHAREALHVLDHAERLGPATRALVQRRALYLAQAGDQIAAQRIRRQAEAIPLADALDHFLVGQEEYRRANWNEAIAHFQQALQFQPDHFWSRYYLSLCWLKNRRPELAASSLTDCLGWRPEFPWLYLLRGSAWIELGQLTRAAADFASADALLLDDTTRYGLLVNRAVLRLREGHFREAEADLQAAAALRPAGVQARLNLAQLYQRLERPADALRQLDEAIVQQEDQPSLYRSRGQFYLQQQELDKALRDFRRSIELERQVGLPTPADTYQQCGRILHRQGHYQDAVESYDQALQSGQQDALTHRLRAEALLEMNEPAKALRSLDSCVETKLADAGVYRARAVVNSRLGRYSSALADYTRALESEATDAATYSARGWLHCVTGAWKLALVDFEEALRLDQRLGEAYVGRGHALLMLGQTAAGLADLDNGVRLGPETPRLHYAAARSYALAALKVAEEYGGREDLQTREVRRRRQDRAISLLARALDLVPAAQRSHFWHSYVRNDAALVPLHNTTTFAQLAARYGKPSS